MLDVFLDLDHLLIREDHHLVAEKKYLSVSHQRSMLFVAVI